MIRGLGWSFIAVQKKCGEVWGEVWINLPVLSVPPVSLVPLVVRAGLGDRKQSADKAVTGENGENGVDGEDGVDGVDEEDDERRRRRSGEDNIFSRRVNSLSQQESHLLDTPLRA